MGLEHYDERAAKMSPMEGPKHEKWKARYDYSANRWRMIKRVSTENQKFQDTDGTIGNLPNLTGTTYADIPQHCALFGAIACHAQTPADFADARYWLGGIPTELKRRMWASLPDEVKRGLGEVETQEREAA